MKRKVTKLFLTLFVSLSLFAQNTTTLQKLINKEWMYIHQNVGYEDYQLKFIYTTTTLDVIIICKGVVTADDHPYSFYLSDQIETSFDHSMVGNVQNGKYIISYIPDYDGVPIFDVDEIITITDTYLEIKSLKSGETFKFNAQ